MLQRNFQHPGRDMTILGGWLFADLLLGLMVIFMVAVPPPQKKQPPPPPPPATLVVQPAVLEAPTNDACRSTTNTACTGMVSLQETGNSIGTVNWAARSDINDSVAFSPTNGTLSPGQSVTIAISSIACHNGSFVFFDIGNDTRKAQPVMVQWHCTPRPEQLEDRPQSFTVTANDVAGLMAANPNDTQGVVGDIKGQIKNQQLLRGRSVGLTIVYDGAPDTGEGQIGLAFQVDDKIYAILRTLSSENYPAFARSSYYNNDLYNLGQQHNSIRIDFYLFKQ